MGDWTDLPPSLDPQGKKALLDALRTGDAITLACRLSGINPRTLRRWMELGDPHRAGGAEEPYLTLREEIEEARAEGLSELARRIKRSGDWRAQAWYLERVAPEIFAPKPTVIEHRGLPALPSGADIADVSAELIRRAQLPSGG